MLYNGTSYDGKYHMATWSSQTYENYDDIELVAQDDHNVVLYNSIKSTLSSTKTNDRYCPDVQLKKCMFSNSFC